MLTIVLCCLLFVFYAYFGYPLVLWLLILRKEKISSAQEKKEAPLPSVAVVITVHNEEAVIVEKLENTLSLNYGDSTVSASKVDIVVASDGSTDKTEELVKDFAAKGVRLLSLEKSQGKEFAQKLAVENTEAEILFFTDAKTILEKDALINGVKYFNDSEVGALSSTDRIIANDGKSSGEGFYVKYEMWLRKLESRFCTLIGLSGSCFAVRRQVCEPFRTDIPSDFAVLLRARERGFRGVLGDDVICSYKAVKTEKQEFNRKVRTVLRGITTFFARLEVLNSSKDPLFVFELVSHKLCRWLVPWSLLLAVVFGCIGASSSFLLSLFIGGVLAFLVLAALGAFVKECKDKILFKVPLFFIVTNAAIFVAWLRFFTGKRIVQWKPSER